MILLSVAFLTCDVRGSLCKTTFLGPGEGLLLRDEVMLRDRCRLVRPPPFGGVLGVCGVRNLCLSRGSHFAAPERVAGSGDRSIRRRLGEKDGERERERERAGDRGGGEGEYECLGLELACWRRLAHHPQHCTISTLDK